MLTPASTVALMSAERSISWFLNILWPAEQILQAEARNIEKAVRAIEQ